MREDWDEDSNPSLQSGGFIQPNTNIQIAINCRERRGIQDQLVCFTNFFSIFKKLKLNYAVICSQSSMSLQSGWPNSEREKTKNGVYISNIEEATNDVTTLDILCKRIMTQNWRGQKLDKNGRPNAF